jgi:hypothetical protein
LKQLLLNRYNTSHSQNFETQIFERFKALAQQQENRERIEIEISDLSRENIDLICKLIKSSPHVKKVTITSIEKYTYGIDFIMISSFRGDYMLFYELIDQMKDNQIIESLSVQAYDKYYDYHQLRWIWNDAKYKWSKEVKCDKGLAQLGMNIGCLKHLKELDLNLGG